MPTKAKTASSGPNKWWQWLLIYPTLVVSVASAAPQWVQAYQTYSNNIEKGTYAEAVEQNMLWQKNSSCATAPYEYYANPEDIKIDATICKSGDIFVRYFAPDKREGVHWVPIDKVVGTTGKKTAFALNLIGSAQAASFTPKAHQTQQSANVICQRFDDDRYVVRHVSIGGACYDERIDTYSGTIVDRRQTQCRNSC